LTEVRSNVIPMFVTFLRGRFLPGHQQISCILHQQTVSIVSDELLFVLSVLMCTWISCTFTLSYLTWCSTAQSSQRSHVLFHAAMESATVECQYLHLDKV